MIRRIGLLVRNDLRRRLRSPLGLVIMLLFPVIFAFLIALSFGSGGDRLPKVHLLIENRDGEFGGNALASSFTSKEMAKYVDVEMVGPEGTKRMEEGDASALLRIPENFTESLIDGKPATLSLVRNPAQGILPEIAEQILRVLTDVLDSGSRVLRGPLDQLRPFLGKGKVKIDDATIVGTALSVKRTIESAEKLVFPPAITLDTAAWSTPEPEGEKDGVSTIFLLVLPGISVYALFLVGDIVMRDLLAEAGSGTLRRLLAGPLRAGTIVAAKAVSTGALSLIALGVLSIVGALVLRRGVDPAGFLLLSLALVLSVTGTSATIYGLAGNERRGGTISSIVYLVLGFGSGSFVPLESLPPAVRAVAPASPFYWGTQGFRKLIESGGTLADVLPNAGILAAIGIVLLLAGSVALHRAVQKGSLA